MFVTGRILLARQTTGIYQNPQTHHSLPMKTLLTSIVSIAFALQASAAIIPFDLVGTAGAGLLPGNEPGSITGGTGGELGAGITYDDVANLLTVNVGWGSSQGFNDLSSLANNSHIHGPTASNNGAGFTQTAGVVFTLTRSSSAVTGGVFTNAPILLTAAQETDLLNGKYYINLHTVNNGGGEMRGFLVAVPEPAVGLAALALLGVAAGSRVRRRKASTV
jgi:CHRD domain